MKFLFAVLCFSVAFQDLYGQNNYPQNYFRNPLDIPIKLAGNFAECRPNHFHTGLDMKTNEQENLKVYAAAEGYVSRISISHSGYGNCIYITHPNGYTTVYGHLNDFFPELQQYVVAQQYKKESWNMDITLAPNLISVKKGQFIAFSGTTGGSTGPHLHFEVRNTKTQHVLNGALFGFEYADPVSPVAKKIAVYTSASVYEQNAAIYSLKKAGGNYTTAQNIKVNDDYARIAVRADDYMTGSPNTLGVFQMELYLDDSLQAAWKLDDINFDENRYVNAFADYKLKEENKGWFQTLFKTPGNKISNYTFLNNRAGALDLSDGKMHKVKILLYDVLGNTSNIIFNITGKAPVVAKKANCILWKANQANSIQTNSLVFKCDANALYDDICMQYTDVKTSKGISNEGQLMNTKIPLQTAATLKVKLNTTLAPSLYEKLVFIHHVKAAALPGNNPQDAAAADYSNGWATAQVKTFGNYYVDIDTIAPVITPLQKSGDLSTAKQIRFTIKDNLTSVTKFSAKLDGVWLRFVRAGDTYTYTFDDHCPSGNHSLLIEASDENNNENNLIFTFVN